MSIKSVRHTLELRQLRDGTPPQRGLTADKKLASTIRWRRIRQWDRIDDECANLLPWINLNPAGNEFQQGAFKKGGTGWNMVALSWRWGFDGCIAYNVFPMEDRDPDALDNWFSSSAQEFIHAANSLISEDLRTFDAAIAAWGTNKHARRFVPALLKEVQAKRFEESPTLDLWCLKKNSDGSPKHPARISHSLFPERYIPSDMGEVHV